MKKYYKVIRAGSRTSAFLTEKTFRVTYPVGQWAVPSVEGSKLTAFDSLQHALTWMNSGIANGKNLICVPCLVKNPIRSKWGVPLITVASWNGKLRKSLLIKFWKLFEKYSKEYGSENLSKIVQGIRQSGETGMDYVCLTHCRAVLCSSIKCLE